MKSINKILLIGGIAVSGLGFGACTDDLNLTPTDPNDITPGTFADDPDGYMNSVFADVFFNFVAEGPSGGNALAGVVSNGGFGVFQRAVFNLEEIPTDNACWLWYQGDPSIGSLPFGQVSTAQEMAYAPYYRFMVNASICNDFIQNCLNGFFDGANEANMKSYMNQARVMRQMCMYYLLDLYGNVPWIDDETPVGATPAQHTSAEIYELLAADMEQTLENFDDKTPAYGYVGKDACEAYLVKLYLNAEVYCGTPAWDKAYKHAKAIIDRHQGEGFKNSGLAFNYNQLFGAKNGRFAPGGGDVNEILMTLPSMKDKMVTWGCATLMLNGYINDAGDMTADDIKARYNVSSNWNCIVARRQLVEKFDWNEPEMATSPDQRTKYWQTSKDGFSYDGLPLLAANCPHNGYPTIKFTNWVIKNDGTEDVAASGSVLGEPNNTDYAMVRLAEIYLSAAEAILNGAGGREEALKYVNYIRERAGLQAWTSSQMTLETLRDERQRELYGECVRRTDLKRYGQWISGYNWDFKGNPSNLAGQDFPASFNYYPLPSQVCTMAGYTQNPGY